MDPHRAGRGAFVTFEGIDGSGKTAHARTAADRLEASGIEVVRTREPGGSAGAEAVRALLTGAEREPWDAVAETFLLSAARSDHCRRVIGPALARGSWVVSDRFVDSMFAYQGAGLEVPDALLEAVALHSVGGLMPDLTVVCDADVDTALARIEARSRAGNAPPTHYERAGRDLRKRIRQGFLDRASRAPGRCVVVDTTAPRDEAAAQIWSAMAERLGVARGEG